MWAAHSGAGASTIALALADAAAQLTTATLLDAAAPGWSVLTNTVTRELGGDVWRHAERGDLRIERLALPATHVGQVPPPPAPHPGTLLTIVDTGWSLRELHQAPGHWLNAPADVELLVLRAHLAGIQLAERALRHLTPSSEPPSRSPSSAPAVRHRCCTAAGGRHVRALCAADAVTWFPLLAHPPGELAPIDSLPRPLLHAARQLLDRLDQAHTRPAHPAPSQPLPHPPPTGASDDPDDPERLRQGPTRESTTTPTCSSAGPSTASSP